MMFLLEFHSYRGFLLGVNSEGIFARLFFVSVGAYTSTMHEQIERREILAAHNLLKQIYVDIIMYGRDDLASDLGEALSKAADNQSHGPASELLKTSEG